MSRNIVKIINLAKSKCGLRFETMGVYEKAMRGHKKQELAS